MLRILEQLPPGLLATEARNLHEILPAPTLIHLPGRRPEPLFVSVLLHGNETTGLAAIQALLRKYQDRELPRALSVFFGNISAAREGHRHLEQQPDYNRIWPCQGSSGDSPEHAMMRQILDEMRARDVFASIDIHNNTGLNPHYGCVNRLDPRFFRLATLFSRTVVYFIRPCGVQSMAFAELCPAVTVECGKPDQAHGTAHAAEFVETCLHLAELPDHPVAAHDLDLFHTVATVTVPEHLSFGFDAATQDIQFIADLDHLNFRELAAGSVLGRVHETGAASPLCVTDEQGHDVSDRYFSLRDGEIRTTRIIMPSMFTLDAEVIRQDCLGYLMERMPL
jgi:succinylglutamate desuccinylase